MVEWWMQTTEIRKKINKLYVTTLISQLIVVKGLDLWWNHCAASLHYKKYAVRKIFWPISMRGKFRQGIAQEIIKRRFIPDPSTELKRNVKSNGACCVKFLDHSGHGKIMHWTKITWAFPFEVHTLHKR